MIVEPQPVAVAGLTVAAVARRMGVAPATLRTWDRRYGVGPGHHEPGTHRRYSPADLARLEHMRRLVISGVPPADAARSARGLDDAVGAGPPEVSSDPAPAASAVPAASSRAGGGHVVAQPGATPAERGLARAAQALDSTGCEVIITESIDRRGVVWTWDRLILPVLIAVGEQWQLTGRGVEIEHALTASIHSSFSAVVRSLSQPTNARTVLLASAPDDPHTLPQFAVAAALAERRIESRILGANMPVAALAVAIERIGPAAVFIWAQIPGTADLSVLSSLPASRPRSAILVGGHGWTGEPPASVTFVSDLSDTVAQIARAVGE